MNDIPQIVWPLICIAVAIAQIVTAWAQARRTPPLPEQLAKEYGRLATRLALEGGSKKTSGCRAPGCSGSEKPSGSLNPSSGGTGRRGPKTSTQS